MLLKTSDELHLPVRALDLQGTPSVWVQGKGRKERVLPLWKQAAADLRAWLAIRGDPLTPEVFVSARGGPMSRSGFEYVLSKHVGTAVEGCPSLRLKRVAPHVLRHTAAMLVLQATGDIRKVSLWLGHASIHATEIYLRADPSEKLEAIDAMAPLALKRGQFRPPDKLIASLHGS